MTPSLDESEKKRPPSSGHAPAASTEVRGVVEVPGFAFGGAVLGEPHAPSMHVMATDTERGHVIRPRLHRVQRLPTRRSCRPARASRGALAARPRPMVGSWHGRAAVGPTRVAGAR